MCQKVFHPSAMLDAVRRGGGRVLRRESLSLRLCHGGRGQQTALGRSTTGWTAEHRAGVGGEAGCCLEGVWVVLCGEGSVEQEVEERALGGVKEVGTGRPLTSSSVRHRERDDG